MNDHRAEYAHLSARVLRLGNFLTSPYARTLPEDDWEALFGRYQDDLDELRRLGDQLRRSVLEDASR